MRLLFHTHGMLRTRPIILTEAGFGKIPVRHRTVTNLHHLNQISISKLCLFFFRIFFTVCISYFFVMLHFFFRREQRHPNSASATTSNGQVNKSRSGRAKKEEVWFDSSCSQFQNLWARVSRSDDLINCLNFTVGDCKETFRSACSERRWIHAVVYWNVTLNAVYYRQWVIRVVVFFFIIVEGVVVYYP